MKKLLLGLFVFCLLFTGTAVHAGWVSDAVLKEILQFRASLGASAYNAYPSSYTDTSTVSSVSTTPSVTVLSPNGGDTYNVGSKITITWKTVNIPASANMYVCIKNGTLPCTALSTLNTGKVIYDLNNYKDVNIAGSNFKVMIRQGATSSIVDYSDKTFSIISANTVCPPAPPLAQCPTGQTGTLTYDANKCVIGQTCTVVCPSGGCVSIPESVPFVSSPVATSVTQTAAVLGATFQPNYNDILERGICYGIGTNPRFGGALSNCIVIENTQSSISVSGLTSNTQYYFKGYAKNSIGIGYSEDGTFTTGTSSTVCPVGCTCSGASTTCPVAIPSLTVLSPNGGEIYNLGDKITIKWKSENIIGNIVELNIIPTYMQYGEYMTFEKEIPNNGSYTITLPGPGTSWDYITLGKNFKAEVVALDGAKTIRDSSDDFFTINPGITCPAAPSLAQCPAGTTSQLAYDANKCVIGQTCVANPTPIPTVICPVGLISKDSCDSIKGTFKTNVDSSGCTITRCVPTSTSVITRTLKMGMRGADVKILQTYLGIKADGHFGRSTKIKVIQWQKANGLTADGIFGPSCILKSGLGVVTPTPTPTPSPTPVPTPSCTNGATNYPTCTSELKVYSNVSNPIAQNISTSAKNSTSGIIGIIFNIKNTSNIDVVIKTISATLGNNNPNISGYYLSDGSTVIASLGNPNSTIVTFTNLPSTLVVPANSIKTLNIKMDVSATTTPGYQTISVAASDIAAIDSNSSSLSSSLTGVASGLKQTFQATDVIVTPVCSNGATNPPTCIVTPVCPPAPSLAQCPANTTSQLTYDTNKCVIGQICNPVATTLACGSGGSCTAADIAPHNTRANCWVYMSGAFTTKFTANKAYNITSYVANGNTHPGGDVIASHCGGNLYDYVVGSSGGHTHSSSAINTILQSYYIGPML